MALVGALLELLLLHAAVALDAPAAAVADPTRLAHKVLAPHRPRTSFAVHLTRSSPFPAFSSCQVGYMVGGEVVAVADRVARAENEPAEKQLWF